LRLDRAFMTLSAAENGLGMCVESTVLIRDYLQQGRLVMPFGDRGLPVRAHYLAVPKNKEHLQTVQIVLQWINSWMHDGRAAASASRSGDEAQKKATASGDSPRR
jgi:LysR family glycine cleavage system transcriptional activator